MTFLENLLFGNFKFHWGTPSNKGVLKFHTGTTFTTINKKKISTPHYKINALKKWYGFSMPGLWIGIQTFTKNNDDEEEDLKKVKRPGLILRHWRLFCWAMKQQ